MRLSSLILPELEAALLQDPAQAAELADELRPADLAELIQELGNDPAGRMLAALPVESAAAALDLMDKGRRADLVTALDRSLAARVVAAMSADERADLFRNFEDELRADLFARMPRATSADVRDLIQYEESSAGGRMTTDYVALTPDLTVERAIDEVRRTAEEKETIYEAYAVDPNGTLLGAVSLRDLVLARAGQTISAIMDPEVVSVPPEMDQEDVARVFDHYGLLAVPVVDAATRKLLGIVSYWDPLCALTGMGKGCA